MAYTKNMKLEDFLSDHQVKEVKEITHPFIKVKLRPDYVFIEMQDEKLMVSIEDYFSYKIKDLKGFDDELYAKLKENEKLLKAYRSCLRKLSSRDYTIRQIKDHLYKQELHKDEVEQIVAKLIAYGLLDDEKYAQNRISYYDSSLMSAKQIRQKLTKEGIDDKLIDDNLKYDRNREYLKAKNRAEKLVKTTHNKSLKALKQGILTRLAADGFSYELSNETINELELSNDNEDELLQKEYNKALKKYAKRYEGYDLKQRLYASLMAKGFRSEDIRRILEVENGQTG